MTGRITELGSVNRFISWGNDARSRLADTERQIATGKKYEQPSAVPTDAGSILSSRNRLARLEQFLRNQANATDMLAASDNALQGSTAALTQARTLALQAVNDATSIEGRHTIAAEIRSVAREVLSMANTTFDGRPIFAGTSDSTKAFDDTGAYLGDGGAVRRRVNDQITVEVGKSGPEVFGTDDPADPYNGTVFQVLEQLATDIENSDIAGGRDGIEAIDDAADRILAELGRVGGLTNRIDSIGEETRTEEARLTGRLSRTEDTDLAEAVVRLRSSEASYEATLAASARALNRSLLDFLR